MHLSGRANWWLPGWLDRALPHLSIEPATEPPVPPSRPRARPPGHACHDLSDHLATPGAGTRHTRQATTLPAAPDPPGRPRAVVPSARPTVRGYSIRHSRIRQPTGFISPRLLAAATPPARHTSPASALRSPILVRCCRPCQPAETCAISAAPCAFSAIFFIAQRDAIWCRGSLMAGVMCLGGRLGVGPVVLPSGEPSSAGAGPHQACCRVRFLRACQVSGCGEMHRPAVGISFASRDHGSGPRPGGERGRRGPGCGTNGSFGCRAGRVPRGGPQAGDVHRRCRRDGHGTRGWR